MRQSIVAAAERRTPVNARISCAVAAILGGVSLAASGGVCAQTAPSDNGAAAPASPASDALATITVTAQRRTENMQDVPISMQALTARCQKSR